MNKLYPRILGANTIIIAVILLLMPFHAFFATVAGHFLGHKEIISAWKEILILLLAISSGVYLYKFRNAIKRDFINLLVLLIVGLSLVISVLFQDINSAFLVGIKTNLVALVLFLCAQIVSGKFDDKFLSKLILIPAVVVCILAFVQPYLFGVDLLLKIGYVPEGGSGSIWAGQYIESARDIVRSYSTLGGPNQLGAYLLIPALISGAYAISKRSWKYAVLGVIFIVGIYVSYSRSALIGLMCGILVLIGLNIPKKYRTVSFGVIGVVIVSSLVLLLLPNRCFVSNLLPRSFTHGSCESGQLSGSDNQRLESQKAGIIAIVEQPLGAGLGSAGPASFYSEKPLITENWYLQIAIETGLIGLLLYIVFFVSLGKSYYVVAVQNKKESILAGACLAILVGVSVTAIFLHTWADSTLVLIGFSLFGIVKGRIK